MNYYEVLVGAMQYHGEDALTYSWDEGELLPGQIVRVALRERSTLGIVLRRVSQPTFKVKPIAAVAPYPPLPPESLQLMAWLRAYYPAPLGAVIRQFVPPSEVFPKVRASSSSGDGSDTSGRAVRISTLPATAHLDLTADQAAAVAAINGPGTFLLHGITGSGKSRVYVELAAHTLGSGRSAIILTPEIGLTAQLTATFRAAFGDTKVYVLHSQLTAAERRDIWYALLDSKEPAIVIGPRSALLGPVRNVGLVVLDEAHDNAYKNESAPHYHAARVAAKLAELHGASLVLGSATPSVEDYYLAGLRNRPIITMDRLAKQADTPITIETIDMRRRELFSRTPILSDALLTQIGAALQRGEQTLLFLNRRGTANVVLCNACGWQALCPHCDLALTYHGDAHELRCHVCGHHEHAPTSCPICNNAEILFKSVGTKAVMDILQRLFPAARLQRFDTDTKRGEHLAEHVSALAEGSADIIVGTQMISKGLDLPKLSVVGIVNADSSLLIPDYSAAEQTYQLISQVVGRVGRGHRAGIVVLQTYNPENTTLLAAAYRRWQEFYDAELAERRTYKFPPYTYLLKLRILRATSKSSQNAATKLAGTIRAEHPNVSIDGPAPSFHPRERGKYSWQLLIKSSKRSELVEIINKLPSGWTYDIDPINLL